MSKLTLASGSVRTLQVTKRWFNLLNASHPFAIRFNHDEVVGMVGRQYDFADIKRIEIHNTGDDELHIEYEIANIHITSVADGNVKIVNSINVERIEDEVNVIARTEIGQEINTLNDIEIQPHSSQLIINASANRAELMAKNISATPAVLRFGGAQVSNSNGIPVVQNGTFVLSNGAALYAYNTSDRVAKVSLLEVMQ
ncbi:hypothetical protein CWB73_00485 [Pseudoalteromonas phenolica]|uniref:Uncharacterized protein n=1 Tax=Pseudoalteromonas phenolica TaxID=161398 RepID=A0A5S3YYT1_9GAMM|nr:hypothetical protein [Pseudoalteromonas phenolica]TMP84177.1 hypothetical protein CWB73_00485 [Pseudoalteromonas phenolica]